MPKKGSGPERVASMFRLTRQTHDEIGELAGYLASETGMEVSRTSAVARAIREAVQARRRKAARPPPSHYHE